MDQYRNQFGNSQDVSISGSDGLEHYRFQIGKLEQQLKDQANAFKKRIAELQGEIYNTRRNAPSKTQANSSRPAPKLQNSLNYQLYEKDLQIRQLKAENVKLRQIINNPDKVLLRRTDHFEAIAEKQQQIIRLRKTIQQLEGKHDGQYLSQQKLKKQNEMLLHQIQQLKIELKRQNRTRFGFNQQTLDPELMEAIRYKKELQVCRKEIITLENVIKNKQNEIQLWRNKYAQKNNYALGFGTQVQDMKLELAEYRDKNKELNKVVTRLQNQNQKLFDQRDRARFAAEQRVPEVTRKTKNETDRTESQMRYHNSRDIAMKSMVPAAQKTAVRRTNRYDQFHFSDWQSVA